LVYIKRIDLRGFKTFGRKVTLKLGQGLTVVTGPNGSGKSNVLDSLRFALGELSPKELRGSSLSDLVSKSTLTNPPRSAYVSVQFDNADRRLPIDSGSVTISREFYKSGEGVYRLNGRRVSRKQLTELLSSADIQVSGYNIVPQHAITRLAEVTSEERRKIVEDLVGLGTYDLKKNEAQLQLSQADTNLKIALARVEEVRLRVESLERERNDFLRHSLLTKEIARLQAQTVSNKILSLDNDLTILRQQIESKKSQINNFKAERDRLSTSRLVVEQELRDIREMLMDQGGQKIHELEMSIGEANSEISSLRADIESKKLNLQLLKKQRAGLEQDSSQHESELENLRTELTRLNEERNELEEILRRKETEVRGLTDETQTIRNSLAAAPKALEGIDKQIDPITTELITISSKIESETTRISIIQDQSKTLQDQESQLTSSTEALQRRREELSDLRTQQEQQLSLIEEEIAEMLALNEAREKEVDEAARTARLASGSVLEIDSQNRVIDLLAPEELALAEIEDLQLSGRLHNVVGRFRDLIQVDKVHEPALNAACADWLNSLIVKDVGTAIACVEYLKRSRLSRIKIIPLDMVEDKPPVAETPSVEGVVSRITDCIRYDDSLEAAVHFVLGDTVVTDSQKAAYLLSLKGFRAVVLAGDLYEPGGALEGGYYRTPLDISSIVPRTRHMNDFRQSVATLTQLIETGKSAIVKVNSRIAELRGEKIALQRDLDLIRSDIERIQNELSQSKGELENIANNARAIQERITKAGDDLQSFVWKKSELEHALRKLEDQKTSLTVSVSTEEIQKAERHYALMLEELNRSRSRKAIVDSGSSSASNAIESKSKVLERTRDQLNYVLGREQEILSQLESAEKQLVISNSRLMQITSERRDLTSSLEDLKKSAVETQAKLDQLNESLRKNERELEPLSSNLTMLSVELNKKELEKNYLMEELGKLGFGNPLKISDFDAKRAEGNMSMLREELRQIGAINELAVAHYEEQRGNYKQLSIRINQLEQEKQSIVKFMDEMEQKKRDTFMNVFETLNHNFNDIFSKITDGGTGRLVLENPEDLFSGGVDMTLAFPGKAGLSIGSASGGEKSVATVCFLLALQAIHPMPFYVFDEIDAHLDMVNSQRLANLLKERSVNSQFVVVSLKDSTIARADGVYGVFIQDGVSQVISLPKVEAQPNV